MLSALGPKLPELWGGSADLAGSNNTTIKGAKSFGPPSISTEDWQATWYGRTLHFGIREHAMGAILSGIVLHGPTRPLRRNLPAVRRLHAARGATGGADGHRSRLCVDALIIGLGEDGPTHQPIEHLAALRAIPRLSVVRPADPNETAYAWRTILQRGAAAGAATRTSGPTGLILSRQGVPVLEGTSSEGVARGGYVLGGGNPADEADVIIIATGSEVQLAVEARELLAAKDIRAAVVSMPCVEWFEAQPKDYRDTVLPPTVSARVAVEAGIAQSWYKYVGDTLGEIISIEHYGASADDKTLFRNPRFTVRRRCRRRGTAIRQLTRPNHHHHPQDPGDFMAQNPNLAALSAAGVSVRARRPVPGSAAIGQPAGTDRHLQRGGRHHQSVDLPGGDVQGHRLRRAGRRTRRTGRRRRRHHPHHDHR